MTRFYSVRVRPPAMLKWHQLGRRYPSRRAAEEASQEYARDGWAVAVVAYNRQGKAPLVFTRRLAEPLDELPDDDPEPLTLDDDDT